MADVSSRKVSPGDPLSAITSASHYNKTVDVVNWYSTHIEQGNGGAGNPGSIHTDKIRVQNISGATRDRGDILEIGDILESEIRRTHLWFEGDTPTPAWGKRYAVLLNPATNGTITEAQVSGICLAQVNITNTSHTTATIDTNTYVLQSSFNGPIDLFWTPGNTNTQTCAVVLPAIYKYKPFIKFTLSSALTTSEASETATIQSQHGPGLDNPNTGAGAITVHNVREHTASTYIFEGDSGDYGTARWDYDDEYIIVNMECP